MDDAQRLLRGASFGTTAAAYERSRPTYPDAAVDWLIPVGARRVLDLGAGTGKLTRSLVARDLKVSAVDPSMPMLEQLRGKLPGVAAYPGTAEAIPLAAGSLDVVIVAQAWHWFDPALAVAEVARVLVPGGLLGLLWNKRDTSVDWVARLEMIIERHDPAPQGYAAEPRVGAPFGPLAHRTFAWSFALDQPSLLDLVASRSVMATMSADDRISMLGAVRALFHAVVAPGATTIALPYITRCYRSCREG